MSAQAGREVHGLYCEMYYSARTVAVLDNLRILYCSFSELRSKKILMPCFRNLSHSFEKQRYLQQVVYQPTQMHKEMDSSSNVKILAMEMSLEQVKRGLFLIFDPFNNAKRREVLELALQKYPRLQVRSQHFFNFICGTQTTKSY